ncbi:beta-ketoacyl-[acyl-carrier-protein] synthase family protein [Alkalilimnicola sp. S0819]|uniref:beta-ketoacyl-[acyl-carrier-protein] synthase family protein n=1 Tax=Alkalilimnicola sp. S0819 TaxID=2613922 RepID=UPI00126259D8|nr:beta-ketoacyl-[acyl-carrier-protein] synthase family protein [Alkalilimnicola sp. S0819]KAB7624182.1 beta-ketoacyl-[acyl-carrier-protein] synthase family protein [Alkalilimnicola sp. S0819]MPQ16436.1 beta-ketoacyl-ACP synthase [Alkalilimnicola sp. S0819]
MKPLPVTAYTLSNALGTGRAASLQGLREARSGLRPLPAGQAPVDTWVGAVEGLDAVRLPAELARYDCRNNRLAQLTLEADNFADTVREAIARYGAERIGLFMGTSTAGIAETERAYTEASDPEHLPERFDYHASHDLYSLTDFSRRYLGLRGPALTVSTACSSSAKVFAVARRHIDAGLIDAAVVGGVDSLCLTTLYGFGSLELVSSEPCRPWDARRKGISIGEAGGYALLEPQADSRVSLLGYGESSDAHHMSSPHPEGAGAAEAMRQALSRAGLAGDSVDYMNLHGTATPANDAAEDAAVISVLGERTACSSTKGATGHTLGAAGITEALFCVLALEEGFLPPTIHSEQPDPALRARIVRETTPQPLRVAMTNSLGFGGSNATLVFGRST